MICAMVLAAGESRRMGVQKLLLPYGSATVIEHIVDQLLRSDIDAIYVVVGHQGKRITDQLSGRKVNFVNNFNYRAGMLSSVRCGLQALPNECEKALLVLGDQPSVTWELVNEIIKSSTTCDKGIIVPLHDGKRGHPLLFSTRYRQEIMTGYDDVGLRGLLWAHPDDVHELKVLTPLVLCDMDYLEDYHQELKRKNRSNNNNSNI